MVKAITRFEQWWNELTVKHLIRWSIRLLIVGGIILFALFAWFVLWPVTGIPALEPIDENVYLEQGWDEQQRETYYYTPQGTSMAQGTSAGAIRYDWFVNLDIPFTEERFAAPEHLRKYRFIVPEEASEKNPYRLPIGFTKHFNESIGQDVLDITCAACHNGEIHFTKDGKNIAMRVDGGQAMHAFTDPQRGNFSPVLLASLIYTKLNPFTFDRFAKRVLGDNYPQGKDHLDDDLGLAIKAILQSGQNNPFRHLYPVQEGFGRTDALGRIGNTVFGDHLTSKNYQPGAAPVSYPYLWNIWKFDWVQYNGSVAQPLARNMGEALGVGAIIKMMDDEGNPLPVEQRFDSSVRVKDLQTIEHTLQQLQPPKWPSEIMGEIDSQKAGEGKALFNHFCQGCHGPHAASQAQQIAAAPLKTSPLDQWLIEVIPTTHIGTDNTAAKGFMERRYDLSKTGMTNLQIAETLQPLLLQQMNRNLVYRLTEVIRLRSDAELPLGDLEQQLAVLPDPNALLKPEYPAENYQAILNSIEQLGVNVSVTAEQPAEGYHCDLDCQHAQLLWLLKYARQQNEKLANSFDIKNLTEGEALNIVGLLIKNKYFNEQQLDAQQKMAVQGFGTIDLPQQIEGYKPRPLAGVWSTPPFLHNGSVPSIYQMLLPPEKRSKQFYLGKRDYDAVHLGFKLVTPDSEDAEGFLFDTSIAGNHNTGHGFSASAEAWQAHQKDPKANPLPTGVIGPELSDQQRFAILEYLKIKTDQAECIEKDEQDNCHRWQWN